MRRRATTGRRSRAHGGLPPRIRIIPPREPFDFEELDPVTRHWMLLEWHAEQSQPNPFRSPRLTDEGWLAWVPSTEIAIREGDEVSLAESMTDPSFWHQWEPTVRGGRKVARDRHLQLANTEFGTIYVRGLARRLLEEGESFCQVYRAAPAGEAREQCRHLEEQVFPVKQIYDSHRAAYWPEPGDPMALSIPVGPNCHHLIRRFTQDN